MRHQTPPPPIFIVGSPRSGTTLLAGLLRTTPWGEPFETHFIPKYHGRLAHYGDLRERAAFDRLVTDILAERPIQQRQIDLPRQDLYERLATHNYAAVVHAIGIACAHKQGSESWGDKTPHYVHHMDLLHELFPVSRFIVMVRDGRDVALSLMRKSWGPASAFGCAQQWRSENTPAPIAGVLRACGLLLQVRYEDLLATPEETLSGVLSFLGQPVDRDTLETQVRSIRRQNSLKWKDEMRPTDVGVFESVAGDTLRRYGYDSDTTRSAIGPLAALSYRAQDSAKYWRNMFAMNVIDTVRIRAFGKAPFAE